MIKVTVWKTGTSKGKTGSLAVTIPFQWASALGIVKGDKMTCELEFDERSLRFRKVLDEPEIGEKNK